MVCIPDPMLRGNLLNSSLDELYLNFTQGYECPQYHDPNATWLLGYIVPNFQRPLVWTVEQKIRFIESAWLGFHLGTYVVNDVDFIGRKSESKTDFIAHPLDRFLVDGQQRLNALHCYWNNEFSVFGSYWSEILENPPMARRFRHTHFSQMKITVKDEATICELYNRLNFGGTAHTEDQRA